MMIQILVLLGIILLITGLALVLVANKYCTTCKEFELKYKNIAMFNRAVTRALRKREAKK